METKNYFKKVELILLFAMLFPFAYSQNKSAKQITTTATVEVPTGGQLQALLPSSELDSLIITGYLNNTDITYIRNTMPNIAYLDLSGVIAINNTKTLPNSAFASKATFKTVILPDSLVSIGNNAFQACTALQSVVLPATLTSIGDRAFVDCTALQDVILPESLQTIVNYAFYNCNSLKNIAFPASLTSLGTYAFQYCRSLKTATFSTGLSALNNYVFESCDSLETVTLPSTLTTIGNYTFHNCFSLKSIAFPSTLISIGTYAFRYCSSLETATFTEGLQTINSFAFDNCTSLKTITFPASLTTLGEQSFMYCNSLTSVTFLSGQNGLQTISRYVFYDCPALKTVTLPNTLTSIAEYVFHNCTSLESLVFPEGFQTIGSSAVRACTSLKSVTFPSTLTSIGDYSFYNCYELAGEITFPASLTEVKSNAFNGCLKLTSCRTNALTPPTLGNNTSLGNISAVYVPAESTTVYKSATYWRDKNIIGGLPTSITLNITTPGTLGEKVLEQFGYLNQVNELNVSGTLNSVDFNYIKDMTALVSVDFSGLTNEDLPSELFRSRTGLKEIKLPSNLKTIGQYCFRYCYALSAPDFPDSVEDIGNYAFNQCYNLIELNLPASLKIIRTAAFYECYFITSVNFPNSLTTIGNSAFQSCSRITEIDLPESITENGIGSDAFAYCEGLVRVSIPDHVTTLNSGTFLGCTYLTSITLPSKLTTLNGSVFQSCRTLSSITLPAGLTNMNHGNNFYDCTGLNQIICLQPTPPILTQDIFYGVNKSICELIVPFWAETEYKLADIWKTFTNISPNNDAIDFLSINGSLTFANNVRPSGFPSIEINQPGNLTVRGNTVFNVDEFTLKPQLGYIYNMTNYAQLLSECISMTAQTVKIDMSAYGNFWYYFSFPFDVAFDDITIDADAYFVFRKYDGESRATLGAGNSWKNVVAGDTLKMGTGYVFQCSKNVAHLVLPATAASKNKLFASSAQAIPLNEYATENEANKNWNLTGNPFASYYDIRRLDYTAPITYWNDYYRRYDAVSPIDDAYLLHPYQAFFVQKPNDLSAITFQPEGRQTTTELVQGVEQGGGGSVVVGAASLRSANARTLINLAINSPEASDKTRVVINSESQSGYEMSRDAAKFISTDASVPQLYSLDLSATQYAINERPLADGIVPLGYYAGASGDYTISLGATVSEWTVNLKDKTTGSTVDLNTNDYVFSSGTGAFNNRFELQLTNKAPTVITPTEITATKVRISDKQIIVEAASGKTVFVYTANGTKIAETKMTNGTWSVSVAQGIYIVKVDKDVFKTVVF
jgi:hypothetical protein